jgi:hypothetical protein
LKLFYLLVSKLSSETISAQTLKKVECSDCVDAEASHSQQAVDDPNHDVIGPKIYSCKSGEDNFDKNGLEINFQRL